MEVTVLEEIFMQYTGFKRDAAENEELHNDIPMMLYAGPVPLTDGPGDIACLIVPEAGPEALASALAAMLARLFVPQWIAACFDTYTIAGGDGIKREDLPSNLEQAFIAGDKRVKEALTMTAVDHDGHKYVVTRTYWYDNDHDIWFDEAEVIDGPDAEKMSGPMLWVIEHTVQLYGMSQTEILLHLANELVNESDA